VKLSKTEVRCSTSTIPELRFEDQALTSFSGLVIIQKLVQQLGLKERLRSCVRHLGPQASYHPATIFLLLVTHLVIGWRRLRDLDYYRGDPLVTRLLGLRRMPNVSTVTRALRAMDTGVVDRVRGLLRSLVTARVLSSKLSRLTLDFDGSVLSTKSRTTEGTAVGFNRKSKGSRSYYPLLATVAQTGQVFDLHHRPGNVHDSNGARAFIEACMKSVRDAGFRGILESRLDSAHFNDETLLWLDEHGIQFSVSVPFERFPALKKVIEDRQRWRRIDDDWSYFEEAWKPGSWKRGFRCFVIRQRVRVARKGPIQLELFEPIQRDYEYKVIMTNKKGSARAILGFHNGRGSQENTIGEIKSHLQFDYIPTRRKIGNQVYSLAACLAHNLVRELQMRVRTPDRVTTIKRACLWVFETAGTFRKRLLQRAGRLTRPQGVLALTMAGNRATAEEMYRYMSALDEAA